MLSRVEMCQTALRNMRKYVYLRDCQNKCSMKSATLEYREPMRPKIDYISTEKQTLLKWTPRVWKGLKSAVSR